MVTCPVSRIGTDLLGDFKDLDVVDLGLEELEDVFLLVPVQLAQLV